MAFALRSQVGRAGLLNGKQASAADLRFIANYGLPYQFYEANRSKIGIVGPAAASKIVSYYSLRWQFYEKRDLESVGLKGWNDKLLEAADAALEALSAQAASR